MAVHALQSLFSITFVGAGLVTFSLPDTHPSHCLLGIFTGGQEARRLAEPVERARAALVAAGG